MNADLRRVRPGRLWALPVGALTWAFAVPGSVAFWGAVTLGVCGAVVALWATQLRDGLRCPPLGTRGGADVVEHVRRSTAHLDAGGRARIVVDATEPYASTVPGPRPVICVSTRWLDEPDHLAAAVAHEYGHIGGRHWRTSLWVLPGVPVMWWATLCCTAAVRAQGTATSQLAAAAVVTAGLWCCAVMVLRARMAQRRYEFDADRVAADAVGATAVVEVLRSTGSDGRAHVGPYSRYPHLEERIAALEAHVPSPGARSGAS